MSLEVYRNLWFRINYFQELFYFSEVDCLGFSLKWYFIAILYVNFLFIIVIVFFSVFTYFLHMCHLAFAPGL